MGRIIFMLKRIKSFFYREPDIYIGGKEDPYLLRWHIIPRNRWLNIYLHKFLRDDDDTAKHDHPWWFMSIMLVGAYLEYYGENDVCFRSAGSIAIRKAKHKHRIELLRSKNGERIPCWTLIFTGPVIREWGFHCPNGWVYWKHFVGVNGKGKGCD